MAGGHGTRTTNPNNIDIPDILFRRERGTEKEKRNSEFLFFFYFVPAGSTTFLLQSFKRR